MTALELHDNGARTGFEIEPDEDSPPLGPKEWADLDGLVMLAEVGGVSISPSDRRPIPRGNER